MSYLDFEIEVEAGTDGSYPVGVTRSPAGEAHGILRLPYDASQLTDRLREVELAILRSGARRRRVVSAELTTVRGFGSPLFHRAAAGGDPHCLSDQPPGGRGPRRGATGKVGSSLDRVDLRQRGRGSRFPQRPQRP